MKNFLFILILALLTSCVNMSKSTNHTLKAPPKLTQKSSFTLGGFSGLHFLNGNEASALNFITVTDRGPNADSYSKDNVQYRPFALPDYHPELVWLTLSKEGLIIKKRVSIGANSKSHTGLPNTAQGDETPISTDGKTVFKFNSSGIDPEGVVVDQDGFIWIVEEYGPSILKVSQKGKVLQRYIPYGQGSKRFGKEALPKFLSNRQMNRGFEGIAISGNQLFIALQSPIKKGDPFWKNNHSIPIIVFDIKQKKTVGVYAYKFFSRKGSKIGGLTAVSGSELIVIEQNSKKDSQAYKNLVKITIHNSSNLCSSLCGNKNINLKKSNNIKFAKVLKTWSLEKALSPLPEKLEGVALINNNTLALITDNDFGVSGGNKAEDTQLYIYPLDKF